jgi:hypothetical protein
MCINWITKPEAPVLIDLQHRTCRHVKTGYRDINTVTVHTHICKKFNPEQATKAERGNEGIALLFL